MALDHDAHHRVLAGRDLAGHVPADVALALGALGAVRVAEVDHQAGRVAGPFQHRGGGADVPGLVVRCPAAAQDDVRVLVAGGLEDPGAGVLREREEYVGVLRGADRIDRELDASAGAVLEPHRTGQPRGHLAVHLALGGARADCPPTDQVRDVLGGDEVEEFDAGRYAGVVQVEQQAARGAQALVDVEAAVEVGVVDQSFPADRGARLLEVDAHDDEQPIGERAARPEQARGVLAGRRRVVDRARPDDDEEPIVIAVQDPANRLPGRVDELGGAFREGKLLEQCRRGDHVVDRRDPKVVRLVPHRLQAFVLEGVGSRTSPDRGRERHWHGTRVSGFKIP